MRAFLHLSLASTALADIDGKGAVPGADLGDLFSAETNCPPKRCPAGQVAVQKNGKSKKHNWQHHFGGCENSGFDMFSMISPGADGSGLDALKMGGMGKGGNPNKAKLWSCCSLRDAAHRVCGMSKQAIEEEFKKCTKKKCKGDKNCEMQANFSLMMGGGGLGGGDKCKEYNDAQSEFCECVKEDDAEGHFRDSIGNFYKLFAKDKLPEGGKLDEKFLNETVYKKFDRKKKASIWQALTQKYLKKLPSRNRPKPDLGKGLGDLDADMPPPSKSDGGKPKKPSRKAEKSEDVAEEESEVFGGAGDGETEKEEL